MRIRSTLRTIITRGVVGLALCFASATATPAAALADAGPPGDIPDNQAFVTAHGRGFSLQVPEGWSRSARAGSTTFVDKYNAITVRIEPRAIAPTVSDVTRTELARLKAATKGFSRPTIAPVSRPAGAGVLISFQAASPPSPVTGKRITDDVERYELWRSGKVAIVTLEAPHGSDNVDAWRRVTRSLRWTR